MGCLEGLFDGRRELGVGEEQLASGSLLLVESRKKGIPALLGHLSQPATGRKWLA